MSAIYDNICKFLAIGVWQKAYILRGQGEVKG